VRRSLKVATYLLIVEWKLHGDDWCPDDDCHTVIPGMLLSISGLGDSPLGFLSEDLKVDVFLELMRW
jgi:hypothetical protein